MKVWKRDLQVILTSSTLKKSVVFGNHERVNLDIRIKGCKYLSGLKDNFSIRISNLTYSEIVYLIHGQFYDVEIKAGYRSTGGATTIFKGGVLYISNELGDKKTNTVIILCASNLVAKYGQTRMNLTINSGINMYSYFKFLCRRAGITDANLPQELTHKFVTHSTSVNGRIGNILEAVTASNNISITSDSSNGGAVSIWNALTTDKRVIKIKKDTMIFTGSYPRINSEGVQITLMPTFNFMPGDIIEIDNAMLDISAGSKEEVFKNNVMYIDTDGQYMVFEIEYDLQNRDRDYQIRLLCKSKNLVKGITGGSK